MTLLIRFKYQTIGLTSVSNNKMELIFMFNEIVIKWGQN